MSPVKQTIDALDQQAELFESLLEEERLALAERDSQRLMTLAERKMTLANALEQCQSRFLETLGTPSPATDSDDIQRLLSDQPDLLSRWTPVRERLGRIRALNQRNGHQLMLQQRQLDQAVDILSGGSGAPAPATYGSDGKTRNRLRGQRHVQV